jgi:CheY-like chemotaxis protein
MIGRLPVFVMLAGMVWAWDNQVAFASQEPHHCSVVGDLEVRPFTSRVFHNTRKLRGLAPSWLQKPRPAQRALRGCRDVLPVRNRQSEEVLLFRHSLGYTLNPSPDHLKRLCMAQVLCTGVDPVVMKTRQLILENAGHTVVPASDEDAVKAVCAQNKFDVAVIGQNISAKMKTRVLEIVRENCPAAKVLEVYPSYAPKALENADAWLEMPSTSPEDLVDLVNSLALVKKNRAAK